MQTFIVTSAEVIALEPKDSQVKIQPFVGYRVVVNGEAKQIARSLKQTVLDLHKSGRALEIPEKLFDNGVEAVNPAIYNKFKAELVKLAGKTMLATVDFIPANTEYRLTEVSRRVTLGEAKVGDIVTSNKEQAIVDGFIMLPLSSSENLEAKFGLELLGLQMGIDMNVLANYANAKQSLKPVVAEPQDKGAILDPTSFHEEENQLEHEAFGTKPAKEAKTK
jgi:hypothetical protein